MGATTAAPRLAQSRAFLNNWDQDPETLLRIGAGDAMWLYQEDTGHSQQWLPVSTRGLVCLDAHATLFYFLMEQRMVTSAYKGSVLRKPNKALAEDTQGSLSTGLLHDIPAPGNFARVLMGNH